MNQAMMKSNHATEGQSLRPPINEMDAVFCLSAIGAPSTRSARPVFPLSTFSTQISEPPLFCGLKIRTAKPMPSYFRNQFSIKGIRPIPTNSTPFSFSLRKPLTINPVKPSQTKSDQKLSRLRPAMISAELERRAPPRLVKNIFSAKEYRPSNFPSVPQCLRGSRFALFAPSFLCLPRRSEAKAGCSKSAVDVRLRRLKNLPKTQ